MSFISLEDGRNFTRWVGEKFLRFVEFLGVVFEGKEDRVLELLKDIGQEVKGIKKRKLRNVRRERKGDYGRKTREKEKWWCMGEDKEEERGVVLWRRGMVVRVKLLSLEVKIIS